MYCENNIITNIRAITFYCVMDQHHISSKLVYLLIKSIILDPFVSKIVSCQCK